MFPMPILERAPRALDWKVPPRALAGSNERARKDFLRRLGIAETLKREMRRKYAVAVRQTRGESVRAFLSRSREFWEAYEWLNRVWVPEDPVYSKAFQGVSASTSNSTWELAAAASGQLRILESFIGGEATSSTVLRMGINRVSSQGTGTAPTSYTPEKFNTRSPAAAGTYYGALTANVDWGTAEETLNTNPLLLHAFNAFGGVDRWVPSPGEEIYSVNAEYMSLRSISGTPTISGHVIVEEL